MKARSIFASNVKKLRKLNRWTQEDLASISGLTQSAVAQFESGDRYPSSRSLERLSDAFGVSMSFLLDNVKEEIPNSVLVRRLEIVASQLSKEGILIITKLAQMLVTAGNKSARLGKDG